MVVEVQIDNATDHNHTNGLVTVTLFCFWRHRTLRSTEQEPKLEKICTPEEEEKALIRDDDEGCRVRVHTLTHSLSFFIISHIIWLKTL